MAARKGLQIDFTDDYDESCPDASTSNDVVFAYTPSANEMVGITLCNGGQYDTKLFVYKNHYTPGNPFACDDDGCGDFRSDLPTLFLTAGDTYYIVIDGSGGINGNFALEIH